MELKIEVSDQVTFAGTIEQIFASLTPEARERVATNIMMQFITEPHNGERLARETAVLEDLRKSNESGYVSSGSYSQMRFADMTDEQVRATSKFRDRMQNYQSTRDKMIAEITQAAVTTFRARVDEFVKADPQLQVVMTTTLDEIRKAFPAYAHDALMAWFVTNMSNMATGMTQALVQSCNAGELATRIQQRLQQNGINP